MKRVLVHIFLIFIMSVLVSIITLSSVIFYEAKKANNNHLFALQPAGAQTTPFFDCAKSPYSTSPACKGEHPRLHITKDTLPDFQARIAKDYLSEYQSFVNWVDSAFNTDTNASAGLMADNHALIFLLGPIQGITYQHPISEYGARAIQIMMNKTTALLSIPSTGYFWSDEYAKMARAYDWTWSQMTPQERTIIANWIADAGIFASQPLKEDRIP